MLAGISAEYYLRLERGRAQHPSPQIIDALARALQLDRKATRYLHDLAAPKGGDTSEPEVAAHGLAEVIDEFLIPAMVVNRYRDVLRQIRSPARCHQNSHQDRTRCAGAYWTPLPASSTLTGTRRQRSR